MENKYSADDLNNIFQYQLKSMEMIHKSIFPSLYAEQAIDAPYKHLVKKLMCAECHEWFSPQDILPSGTCQGCYASQRIISIE
jgi:hypothetical protein